MTAAILKQYRYRRGHTFATALKKPLSRGDAKKSVRKSVEEIAELQEKLFANNHHALLLVFQGMDAAGKDSTIYRVTAGVNPAGFQVFNFKKPTSTDLDHNFLWRAWQRMPERGRIGIFNRSYYEEVLVVRVHPEIIESRRLPDVKVNAAFWRQRFQDINAMEKHLHRNGTRVVKFFLNVSREEQRQRFLSRLNEPDKHWKFSNADIEERQHWDDYQKAFHDAIDATDQDHAPWYVIPADDKWNMRAVIAKLIVAELEGIDPEFPEPDPEEVALFESARARLLAEAPQPARRGSGKRPRARSNSAATRSSPASSKRRPTS